MLKFIIKLFYILSDFEIFFLFLINIYRILNVYEFKLFFLFSIKIFVFLMFCVDFFFKYFDKIYIYFSYLMIKLNLLNKMVVNMALL